MDTSERKRVLDKIRQTTPLFQKPLRYKEDKKELFGVYEVPLNLLVYNKYNGRIMSRVSSFESSNRILNPELESDKLIIEKFLWESAISNNNQTLESLRRYGQNEVGIITNDGIIIDGNRRVSLLTILNKEAKGEELKFLTVILPDNLQNEPDRISELETIYQIGVDDKVDYNPIEKYLKVKELKRHFNESHIANLMSVSENKIHEYLGILKLMEEYLNYFKYGQFYIVLDKREGHFVDFYKYLNKYNQFLNKPTELCNWDYTEADINQLKQVYFTYIRLGLPVSTCRLIAKPQKFASFFTTIDIWKEFKQTVLNSLSSTEDDSINLGNEFKDDLFQTINSKEERWKAVIGTELKPLLENSQFALSNSKKELDLNNKLSYFNSQLALFLKYDKKDLEGFASFFESIKSLIEKIFFKINN